MALHPWHVAIKAYTKVFFATMTRSGTWYSHYFFEFLEHQLTGKRDIKPTHSVDVYDGIHCLKCHAHSIYPGFPELYHGPLRAAWDELEFFMNGWNNGYPHVERLPEVFSKAHNPELRVVYLFRNPLDNFVSSYHHYKGHALESHRLIRDRESGETRPVRSPSDFLVNGGLEGYLKQYFTFHAMRDDPLLMMVPYETLVRDPVAAFTRILGFVGFAADSGAKRDAIARATAMAAPDKLRAIELDQGKPLAGDQLDPAGSTMHGGAVGKWKDALSDDDVARVRARFAEFGIDLDDFILA